MSSPVITNFAGQNWLITPAALATHEIPPSNIHDQKWLLTLSGVAMVNLEGITASDWLRETLILQPAVLDPVHYAIATHGIPLPAGTEGVQYSIAFQVEQLAPFAGLSSIFDENQSINAGFAVDVWRPNHYANGRDAFSHAPVNNLWTGLAVDVAVRDSDAWIYRVSYSIQLLGKIVFLQIPAVLFQSDFSPTPYGEPPSSIQAVGTAEVSPPRTVLVTPAPAGPPQKWIQIVRQNTASAPIASFRGIFSQFFFDGVYNFSASLFMPSANASGIATISFEQAAQNQELAWIMHMDFMPDGRVRIDDNVEFGSFPRDQVFLVQAILTFDTATSKATAHIQLSGGGASGSFDYTIPVPFVLARQLGAVNVWQGFGSGGAFDATGILVTRDLD